MSAEFFLSSILTAVTDRRYSSHMIIRGRTVLTMHGEPIENGAVAVSGNQIVDVGGFDEIKTRNTGNIVDLGEQTLLPGLINAHCHLDYTCLRGKISPQKSFTDWIRAINAEKSHLSPEDFLASINDGFKEAKRFGTTTIANLTAFPELIAQIQPPIRTCWFVELIDVRAPERANELVESAIESLDTARSEPVLPVTPKPGEGGSEVGGGAPEWDFLWVTDFPLFEWSADDNKWNAMHHPFTRPKAEDMSLFEAKKFPEVRAEAYDVVLNGVEIGGGSMRIYEPELQKKMFAALGISPEAQESQFGHLLRAFRLGTPPHGGIAFGFDRLVMLICGEQSIRDVMAFPKNNRAMDLMSQSPSEVDPKQLRDLGIQLSKDKKV